MQTRVRALFDKLLRHKLDRPEDFLDDLLHMTSRADIVKECVAAEYSAEYSLMCRRGSNPAC